MSIFTVEISRPGDFGINTSAALEMPATWAEYQDAKERARIADDKGEISYELLHCEYDWLRPHISENANLLELNLLASRMEKDIKDSLDIFEAMVKIENERNNKQPLPLTKLINLTYSVENCHIAGDIVSNAQLGRFLYFNDFLSEEDAAAAQTRVDNGKPISDLFTVFGKEHRNDTGGMLTASGLYVEFDGSVNDVYIPGKTAYFDRPGAPVVLEISKGFFNDPSYDNDKKVILNLPASEGHLRNSLDYLDVKSVLECGYSCKDCLIPAAKEWLNAFQDYEQADNFALALDYMERHGGILEYKALLEAVECGDLDTALRLTEDIGAYTLTTECYSPEDYARNYLDRLQSESGGIDLSEYVNLFPLGIKAMEHENAAMTSYGVLRRTDGGPLLSQADQHNIGMEMR